MTAFVDESIRRGRYLLACVVIDQPRNSRTQLRAFARKAGRSSLHFNELLPAQRNQAVELFNTLPVDQAYVFEHRRARGESEMDARAIVVAALVQRLQVDGVTSMRLDQFQGAEKIDAKTIGRARSANREAELHYQHAFFSDEPLLWLADGLAFTAGLADTTQPAWFNGIEQI